MTRILHVLAPAAVGGTETVVENLAAGQRRLGHEARVAVVVEPAFGDHPFLERLADVDVPAEPVVAPHRGYLTEALGVGRLLGRLQPALVHTHGYHGDILAGTVARWAGTPVVSTVHGFTRGGWKNQLYEHLQRRALRGFDGVVAVSRPLARELHAAGVPADRVHVVRNAATRSGPILERGKARSELDLPPDAFVAGWVGRLSSEKGPDLFLRSLARVSKEGVVGVIAGDGELEDSLRSLAGRLDLGESARFLGRVPRAYRLFRAFDVFVLSSRSEGTPMSLMEAMAAEVPVVATRVGGVPDVVGESEALLVPAEDPEALAAAVRAVAAHPGAARTRATRARRRLKEEFGMAGWLDRYDEVYRQVLGPGTEGRE